MPFQQIFLIHQVLVSIPSSRCIFLKKINLLKIIRNVQMKVIDSHLVYVALIDRSKGLRAFADTLLGYLALLYQVLDYSTLSICNFYWILRTDRSLQLNLDSKVKNFLKLITIKNQVTCPEFKLMFLQDEPVWYCIDS